VKTRSKIAVANIANNARVMLTYALPRQRTVRQRLRNFWINENKPNQQRRLNVDKSFAPRERL